MMLNKLSKKERFGLIAAGIFVVFALLDRAVVSPINRKFQRLNKEIEVAELQLSKHLRNLLRKDAVSKEYRKYITYVKKVGSDEEVVAKVLAEIEGLARKSGVSLADIKPQPPKEISFYKQYMVEIKTIGTMNSIMRFLYRINNSTQLLRAEKLRLSVKGKDSSLVKASLLISKILIP